MFANNNTAAPAQSNNAKGNFEPAIGFINVYLPSLDGERVKLGAMGLKGSKLREKALYDALMDPAKKDAVLAAIMDKLILEFNPAEQSAAKGFDLGIQL